MTTQTGSYDYDGVEDKEVSSDKLAQLQKLAKEYRAAEIKVVEQEAALAKAEKSLKDYAENLIPSAMADLGLQSFTTDSGMVIQVDEKIRASIPEEFRPRAFIWLRENNHAALIKHVITLDFSMGEDEKATALIKQLTEEGYTPEEKETVHPATLLSFVKEKLSKGEELPDTFSIFKQDVAKLTLPKAPASKKR